MFEISIVIHIFIVIVSDLCKDYSFITCLNSLMILHMTSGMLR